MLVAVMYWNERRKKRLQNPSDFYWMTKRNIMRVHILFRLFEKTRIFCSVILNALNIFLVSIIDCLFSFDFVLISNIFDTSVQFSKILRFIFVWHHCNFLNKYLDFVALWILLVFFPWKRLSIVKSLKKCRRSHVRN